MKFISKTFLNSRSTVSYLIVSYLMVGLIGIFDYITNPEFSFSLFYLIPISLNAWYTSRRNGYLIAIASSVCWLVVDFASAPAYHNFIAPYWNSTIRLGFFLVVVYLLSEIKYLNRNLEIRVNERTSELTDQIRKKNEAETELTRSKNLYQDLVENINEVYYTTDVDGYFKYVSPNFYKAVGIKESSNINFSFYDIIHPGDKIRIQSFFAQAITNGNVDASCEFRIERNITQTLWYEQNSRILRDSNNHPYEIRSLLRNITERKNAEISLLKSEMKFKSLFSEPYGDRTEEDYLKSLYQTTPTLIMKSLAERIDEVTDKMSSRVKQAIGFSSLASHELRTPLAIIRNLLEENLRADVPVEIIRGTTASIYDEVLRLQRIIGDLLKISKMEAGKFILQKEDVQLDEFLKNFFDEVLLLSQEKNIKVNLCSSIPVRCSIDKAYFLQMLFNIFDNALKYTPHSGEITIGCSLKGVDAVIMIKDNGRGISPDISKNLFKDFYQGDQESSSRGTGLGLILSKWIAELHNGKIEIQSSQDSGTMVLISIPVISSTAEFFS